MRGAGLTVTILGSGTSTGVPVIGCRCSVCTSDLPQNNRTRCSILVSVDGYNILIDTATDLRQQILRERIDRIDAVLYTHTHADHVHGIDDLRPLNFSAGGPIPIFGSRRTIDFIRRTFSYIFDAELDPGYRPQLTTHVLEGATSLFGLPVHPLRLPHGRGFSLGYRLGPLAYLTDCHAVPPEAEAHLQRLELLIIDALRFTPHDTHLNIPQALAAARRLQPRRTLLTHLSHEVEHRRDSTALPPGTGFAYDGQKIVLPRVNRLDGGPFPPYDGP